MRIALITGAGQGLGKCIADTLMSEDETVGVVYCDLDTSKIDVGALKFPEKALCVNCDVRDRNQVDNAFKLTFEKWGHYPNIVVCN